MSLQLRFALSSLTCWRIINGDFNAHVFYQSIIDYFEAPPGPAAKTRVHDLLIWWDTYKTINSSPDLTLIPHNRKVFGYHQDIPQAPEHVSSLSIARLAAQRTLAEVPPAPPVVT